MPRMELKASINFDAAGTKKHTLETLEVMLLELMLAVEGHAKRLAPVDTGRLRASIHTTPMKPAREIAVSDGTNYGVFQEFGTSKMKAHPFLRPGKDIALKVDLPRILKKNGLK